MEAVFYFLTEPPSQLSAVRENTVFFWKWANILLHTGTHRPGLKSRLTLNTQLTNSTKGLNDFTGMSPNSHFSRCVTNHKDKQQSEGNRKQAQAILGYLCIP